MQPELPFEINGLHEHPDRAFGLDYPGTELVFGLVFAVGTDYKPVLDYLIDHIRLSGYTASGLRLSDWFPECLKKLGLDHELPEEPEFDRISSRIQAGNQIRSSTLRQDILALMASSKIYTSREEKDGQTTPHPRRAHILVSLKRPEEVESLRKIYGPGFFLIGVFANEAERVDFLVNRKGFEQSKAESLIATDQKESADDFGQRTRDTFQMADLFVGTANKQYETGLQKFLRLVFGDPFITPSRDEHAMFLAYTASLRSGDLSRQVGAALACSRGDVVSLGCNDVPAPGGGLYCVDDGEHDKRDHRREKDSNDAAKAEIFDDVITAFRNRFLPKEDLEYVLRESRPLLKQTLLADITEFGRSVHAEMDALLAAGRNGIRFEDSTLYTTTFPCHNCTRHIIAAGVKRVVYIEPYPKSRANKLHDDAIRVDGVSDSHDRRIPFQPFLGIGPRRFFDLFSLKLSSGYIIERKLNGQKVEWDQRKHAKPRVPLMPTSYLEREQLIHTTLDLVFSKFTESSENAESEITGEERSRVLERSEGDGSARRKLARMEDRRPSPDSGAGGQNS